MWRAQLEGEPESLEKLRKNFKNYIVLEDDNYYLKCPQFETEEENLLSFAEEVLENMINILDFNLEEKCIANLQGTFENIRNHGKDVIIAIPTARANAKGSSPSITIDGKTLDPDIVNEDLEKSLKCITNNVHIKLALEYYNGCNKHNLAFNLYTILEIIGEDLGSKNNIYEELNISRNKFRMLTRTLNYGLGNKSRHYNHNHPPATFYSEAEVKSLVKNILKEWFGKKCLN